MCSRLAPFKCQVAASPSCDLRRGPLGCKPNAVFNTRIKSALEQLRLGRSGMRVETIAEGRRLALACAFYERRMIERVESERTGMQFLPPVSVPISRRQDVPARRCARRRAVPLHHRHTERERSINHQSHSSRARTRRTECFTRVGLSNVWERDGASLIARPEP